MPQEFWYPISSATHDLPAGLDTWTNNGGANKNASARPGGGRVGPMTHDDGTTYINYTNDGATHVQSLNIDWPNPMATWEGVLTIGYRHVTNGVAVTRDIQMINSAGVGGTAFHSVNNTSASWTTTGPNTIIDAATYRPGGGASWLVGDFSNDMTIFPSVRVTAGTGNAQVTSLWGEISYTTPNGAFVFLLGLAGASALPFVGAMTDLSHFRRYLDWRKRFHPRHTKWAPGEVGTAWADVRAYRSPRYFLPA